jgi:two-component system, NarL family, sensor histidine kinase UhpB
VGLAELGLGGALEALLRLWRESRPEVAIETRISRALGETGDTAELTIYRVVQEALTNVFRHARATSVNITVEPAEREGTNSNRGCALVRVRDNGCGLTPDHKLGRGLTGMRERILALGGTLSVASGDDGVTVEAVIPKAAH